MFSGALRGGRWRRDKEEEGVGAGAEAGKGWFPKEEKPRGRAEGGEELHCLPATSRLSNLPWSRAGRTASPSF